MSRSTFWDGICDSGNCGFGLSTKFGLKRLEKTWGTLLVLFSTNKEVINTLGFATVAKYYFELTNLRLECRVFLGVGQGVISSVSKITVRRCAHCFFQDHTRRIRSTFRAVQRLFWIFFDSILTLKNYSCISLDLLITRNKI
jgi:hypothetical protein